MSSLIPLLVQTRLVAILRLDDLSTATPLVRSLLEGGIRMIEFTLTNPDSPAIVSRLRSELPEFDQGQAAIGLGSIRNRDEAQMAVQSGAQFVVSPIMSPGVIEICKRSSVAVMPGAFSPTEIYQAWEMGADVVKVFPAKSLGPSYIQDILAPMPFLKLMPTGGVGIEQMADYFRAGAVAVGVGGSLIDKNAISEQRWDLVAATARRYAEAARRSAPASSVEGGPLRSTNSADPTP